MTYFMAFFMAIAVTGVIIWAIASTKNDNEIKKNGIITEAVVSNYVESSYVDKEKGSKTFGKTFYSYTNYVKYQNESGETIEAKIGNYDSCLSMNAKVKIKYLPKKPKYVLLMK